MAVSWQLDARRLGVSITRHPIHVYRVGGRGDKAADHHQNRAAVGDQLGRLIWKAFRWVMGARWLASASPTQISRLPV